MKIHSKELDIQGVFKIDYDSFNDLRGSIWSPYIKDEFDKLGFEGFKHDKFATSYKNVLRGIHFDTNTSKLVTTIQGEVDQVVVDMRENSKTYKKSIMLNNNDINRFSLFIPPMVGNAFLVKSDIAVYHYKFAYDGDYLDYDKQFTVKWNDTSLNINWDVVNPILSERDK